MANSFPQNEEKLREEGFSHGTTTLRIESDKENKAVSNSLQSFIRSQRDFEQNAKNRPYRPYAGARGDVGKSLHERLPLTTPQTVPLNDSVDAFELWVALTHTVDKEIIDDNTPEAQTLNAVIDRLEDDEKYGEWLRDKDRFVARPNGWGSDYTKRER
jgi:hypothetical protein